jgi:hypothetical protein
MSVTSRWLLRACSAPSVVKGLTSDSQHKWQDSSVTLKSNMDAIKTNSWHWANSWIQDNHCYRMLHELQFIIHFTVFLISMSKPLSVVIMCSPQRLCSMWAVCWWRRQVSTWFRSSGFSCPLPVLAVTATAHCISQAHAAKKMFHWSETKSSKNSSYTAKTHITTIKRVGLN